jgi:hypothetical protein
MFSWMMLIFALSFKAPPPTVILVTIDGVMWQDIYGANAEHVAPFLYSDFVKQGIAVGKLTPIIASGPNHISLPGYLEITRGHPSRDCQLNTCRPTIDRSVFNIFQRPAVFSSWSTIDKTIPPHSNVYSDTGSDYRDDLQTEAAVNLYLNHNAPDFLWVSLGDTDEWGHANNRARYLHALQQVDQFIHSLVEKYPSATFIVTTDHGRNRNFRDHGAGKDSERVWLMMRGPNVPHLGLVRTSSVSLSNIYPTILDCQSGSHSPDSILTRIQ